MYIQFGPDSLRLALFTFTTFVPPAQEQLIASAKLTERASIQSKTDMQMATLECPCQMKLHVWLTEKDRERESARARGHTVNNTNKQNKDPLLLFHLLCTSHLMRS